MPTHPGSRYTGAATSGPPSRRAWRFPINRLRDQAEEYFRQRTDVARDLDVLAAAMLHFDLAWAAEMEPEKNESIARDLLTRVGEARRDAWMRDAHLGLLGVYVDRGAA